MNRELIFPFWFSKSGPCLLKFVPMLKLYRNFLKPHMYLIFSCLQLPLLEVRCLNIFQLDLTVYFFIVTAKPSEKRAKKLAHLRSIFKFKMGYVSWPSLLKKGKNNKLLLLKSVEKERRYMIQLYFSKWGLELSQRDQRGVRPTRVIWDCARAVWRSGGISSV